MNPFFERLAARSLGALPVLQPRRAARFEAMDASRAVEMVTESEISPTARQTDPPVSAQTPTREATASGTPEAARPLPLRSVPSLTPTAHAEPLPRHETSSREVRMAQEETPLLVSPEPAILVQSIPVMPPKVEPPLRPSRDEGPFQEVRSLLVEAPHPLVLPEPPSRRPRETGMPLTQSQPEQREDIHVTIGRIEIRALPSKVAQTPRRTPESAPSMLDTYLRQRGSGRNL